MDDTYNKQAKTKNTTLNYFEQKIAFIFKDKLTADDFYVSLKRG